MIERLARPGWITLWLTGSAVLLALYSGISFVDGSEPLAALRHALANVLPLALLAAVTHPLFKHAVMERAPTQQLAIHLAFALLFALTWYALTLMTLALFDVLAGRAAWRHHSMHGCGQRARVTALSWWFTRQPGT